MNEEIKSSEEERNTEEKQLLAILDDSGKPFVKKHDGTAVKVEEDKQIDYKDWEGNERTLKVPAGSYVICDCDNRYPKIVTAEDFEKKYKFLNEEKKEEKKSKKESGTKIGLDSID